MDLALVPATPKHAALWLAWRREPAARAHNPMRDEPVERLAARLSRTSHDLRAGKHDDFRWIVTADGEPIGMIVLRGVDWTARRGEIGYLFTERVHGRGIGTAAVALAVDKIFTESRLGRIVAFVSVPNVASSRLLERLGFTREGTLREHHREGDGQVEDAHVYAILAREWKAPGAHAGAGEGAGEGSPR